MDQQGTLMGRMRTAFTFVAHAALMTPAAAQGWYRKGLDLLFCVDRPTKF
jgi:hypothetical protein